MFCTCKKLKMWKKWTIVRTPKVLLSVYLDETLPLQYPLHHIALHPLPPHHPPLFSFLLPLLLPPPPLLLALSQFSQVPINEFMDMSQYTGSYSEQKCSVKVWVYGTTYSQHINIQHIQSRDENTAYSQLMNDTVKVWMHTVKLWI